MRRRKNKEQIKVRWIILGIILFCFALFGLYFTRPLTYQQAVEKAEIYKQAGFYCVGYHYNKDGSCELVFRDRINISEKTIDVVDVETAKRINNEYQR